MAYQYGTRSRAVRDTLHRHLRNIFDDLLAVHDHALEHGKRDPVEQQRKRDAGYSQVPGFNADGTVHDYPHAPRNDAGELVSGEEGLSWAVDTWPWINGQRLWVPDAPDIIRRAQAGDADAYVKRAIRAYMQFAYFIRLAKDHAQRYFLAHEQITGERWHMISGSDWNDDGDITDTGFLDAPHFEIRFDGMTR